jgi:hypothetical protein
VPAPDCCGNRQWELLADDRWRGSGGGEPKAPGSRGRRSLEGLRGAPESRPSGTGQPKAPASTGPTIAGGAQGRGEPKAPSEHPTDDRWRGSESRLNRGPQGRGQPKAPASTGPTIAGGAQGRGEPKAPSEHPTERTRTCVREGAQPATRGSSVHETRSGGEGGIRTLGALAHRFSRAAPSTTRTPLRRGGYQRVGNGRRSTPSAAAPQTSHSSKEEARAPPPAQIRVFLRRLTRGRRNRHGNVVSGAITSAPSAAPTTSAPNSSQALGCRRERARQRVRGSRRGAGLAAGCRARQRGARLATWCGARWRAAGLATALPPRRAPRPRPGGCR